MRKFLIAILCLACAYGAQAQPAARPGVATGKLVSQLSQSLTIEANGKSQTFRLSERSQVKDIKVGTMVVVTYTITPGGNEVVRVVPKPAKPGRR